MVFIINVTLYKSIILPIQFFNCFSSHVPINCLFGSLIGYLGIWMQCAHLSIVGQQQGTTLPFSDGIRSFFLCGAKMKRKNSWISVISISTIQNTTLQGILPTSCNIHTQILCLRGYCNRKLLLNLPIILIVILMIFY